MKRLHISENYRPLLEAQQLIHYDQFMATSAGEMIEEDHRRDVQKLCLQGENYYLKRTYSEKSYSALESYLSGRMAHSKPYNEKLQFDYLQQCGFSTAEVVAAGEELRWGLPLNGFIITREVGGEELSHTYRKADTLGRTAILGQLGQLTARLHRQGFFTSVRMKDVFCTGEDKNTMRLTLIDREVRHPGAKRFSPTKASKSLVKSLARQIRAGDKPTATETQEFVNQYCQKISDIWNIQPNRLYKVIMAAEYRLSQ